MPEDRHSRALDAELVTNKLDVARREAANGLRLYDAVDERIEFWLQPERPFKLRVSAILELNRVTLDGISSYAGNFRPSGIAIEGSQHVPVNAHLVPSQVEDMCDYINDHWTKSAVHLASYVLWRVNWIHPFADGNGRTSRALSYLVLCVRLRMRLPGTNTMPEQISRNKGPYYKALEAADSADCAGRSDLSAMERYLADLLAHQLYAVHQQARGEAAEP